MHKSNKRNPRTTNSKHHNGTMKFHLVLATAFGIIILRLKCDIPCIFVDILFFFLFLNTLNWYLLLFDLTNFEVLSFVIEITLCISRASSYHIFHCSIFCEHSLFFHSFLSFNHLHTRDTELLQMSTYS